MTDETKKSDGAPEEDKPSEESSLEKIAKENAAKKKKREQERLDANKSVLRNYRIKH